MITKNKKQTNIEILRHSIAHLMAAAVQELFPEAKFGIGPVIENGFYYDFDLSSGLSAEARRAKAGASAKEELPRQLSAEDLPKIEKKTADLIKKALPYQRKELPLEAAIQFFKKIKQPYKVELLEDLKKHGTTKIKKDGGKSLGTKKNKVSIYETGNFIDLCLGPHIKNSKEIKPDSFKLTRIAGAYWRGNEMKPMLTRIYGVAFNNKRELENYFKKQEEAEKRDHRILGQKLDLFHIDENIGPGLVLWHPRGALLKKIIIDYALNEYFKNGYQLVDTPHIAKLGLWKTSGHTDFYKESMFPPMHLSEISKDEKEDYQIKPMNCPFHIAIYQTKIRSYKDLPIRYTEIGTVYRYEKSGTLHGLTRVRQITQDDAHIVCTPSQISDEILAILKLTNKILDYFGLKERYYYLATQPEKHIGDSRVWGKAENSLKYALTKLKIGYEMDSAGGAFYGPKIDIKIKDSLGREWQCTTIQFDFNLPERFDMTYVDHKGKKQRPLMIHRALLGALERFIGVLLEYHGGNLPLWLSPVQVKLIPVGARHEKYINSLAKLFKGKDIRAEMDLDNETVSKKIREGQMQKIPYLLVAGDNEVKNNTLRVRNTRAQKGKEDLGEIKINKFIDKILKEINDKAT